MVVGSTFWLPGNCCFHQAQNYESAHCILLLPVQISSNAFVKYTTIHTILHSDNRKKPFFSHQFGEMTPALIFLQQATRHCPSSQGRFYVSVLYCSFTTTPLAIGVVLMPSFMGFCLWLVYWYVANYSTPASCSRVLCWQGLSHKSNGLPDNKKWFVSDGTIPVILSTDSGSMRIPTGYRPYGGQVESV